MAKKWIRAVDVGGNTFIRADVCGKDVRNMVKKDPVSSVEEILQFATENIGSAKGISYAISGEIIDHDHILESPNAHCLDGVYLGTITKERAGLSSIVCNDMEGGSTGMYILTGLSNFLGGTWSSGLGLRHLKNGVIVAEMEGGHIPLDPSPFAPLCGCKARGCAESVIGGESIRSRIISETKALGISIPGNMDSCAFLDEEYDKGKKWALDIYSLIAVGMGTFLSSMVLVTRVPVIVWKGTFAKYALPRIEDQIRKEMLKHLPINPALAEVEFSFSPEPELDGLIGAAHILSKILN